MLARLIQFLLWLIILSWVFALVRRWVARSRPPSSPPPSRGPLQGKPLHRDPMCGAHVAGEISHTVRHEGEVVHFCSPECRQRFLQDGRPPG